MNKLSRLTWLILIITITLAVPANAREFQDNSEKTENLQLAAATQGYTEIWEPEAEPAAIDTFEELSEQLNKRINQQLETVISGMLNEIIQKQTN